MDRIESKRVYTFVITEYLLTNDGDTPYFMRGFVDAADFRDWLVKMLAESGPLDTDYDVQVSA